jgi:hypothetical protein
MLILMETPVKWAIVSHKKFNKPFKVLPKPVYEQFFLLTNKWNQYHKIGIKFKKI